MAKYRSKGIEPEQPQGAPQFAGETTAAAGDRERVAQRAYELYLERGSVDGQDMADWLSAERELTGRPRSSSEDPSRE